MTVSVFWMYFKHTVFLFFRIQAKKVSVCPGDEAPIAITDWTTGRCQHRVSPLFLSCFVLLIAQAEMFVIYNNKHVLSAPLCSFCLVCLLSSLPFSQIKGVSVELAGRYYIGFACAGQMSLRITHILKPKISPVVSVFHMPIYLSLNSSRIFRVMSHLVRSLLFFLIL